jgi:heptosyltransferase I
VNILIVKPSSFGDILHAFPAVELIRQAMPEAHITWVVNDTFAGIVELFPAVDEIVVFRRKRLGQLRHCFGVLSFLSDLRQRRYDVVIDLQGLLRSGLIAWFSGGRRRVGFRRCREGAHFFYSDRVLLPANLQHAADKNVFLVRSAMDIRLDLIPPILAPQHDLVKAARQAFGEHGLDTTKPVFAVAPGSRWGTKTWPPDFFGRVLDAVAREVPDVQCWVLGSDDERSIGEQVVAACAVAKPENLAGETDLQTLVELLRLSTVLLTNDSGPMHLAAALGIPAAALFGPTDPQLTGPYGEGHEVFTGSCELAPCFSRECPLGSRECHTGVDSEAVAAAVIGRLKESALEEDDDGT